MISSSLGCCVQKFTEDDFLFIAESIGGNPDHIESIVSLILDEDTRNHILDNPKLFEAVQSANSTLSISNNLYFYLIVRKSFLDSGIEDPLWSEYVASVLSTFIHAENYQLLLKASAKYFAYSFEVMDRINKSDAYTSFELMIQTGNLYLLLSGCFEEFLHKQQERYGAPNIDYYINSGQSCYNHARNHPLSKEFNMEDLLVNLSDHFPQTRTILHDMTRKYLVL